jgi:hypothetical protein
MTPASAHQFFQGSASVAGALIGLLFVAISVAPERILGPNASELHGVRAGATLTAFTKALTVSLFGLVPDLNVGGAATAVSIIGLLFVGSTTLCMLVIVCFLIGISRAWELVGGPNIDLTHHLLERIERRPEHAAAENGEEGEQ